MRARLLRHPAVFISLVGLVGAGVIACATGTTEDLGPTTDTAPTQPAPTTTATGPTLPATGNSGAADSGGDSSSADSDSSSDAALEASVDAGPACVTVAPSNVCGLAPQCGCAINQTCDVTDGTSGAVSCVLAGGGPQGSFCTSTTQCARGFTCAYNACRPYCATVGTACGAGLGACEQEYDPTGKKAVTNAKVCAIACDIRSPAAACGSNNCIFDESFDVPDCDKSGTAQLQDSCTKYNDCAQGLGCAKHPIFGYECEKWCRLGGSDCGFFESCVDLYGAKAPTSGGVKLGHCQE